MRKSLLIVILGGFLVGAVAGAVMLVFGSGVSAPRVETTGKALIGGPFTLLDSSGKTVTDQDFRGRYMLVFFGFTHCPDVCPAEMQILAASLEELGPLAAKVTPIFITVDPERDTPQVMDNYVRNFGANFVGLTGSPEQIAKAAKAYKVTYSKIQEDPSSNDYEMDHSALVYLMGPDGAYLTHFAYGAPAPKVAETLRRYL